MFLIGVGGLLLGLLFGLWLWLSDGIEGVVDKRESKPDPEADAEFERAMKDIEAEK